MVPSDGLAAQSASFPSRLDGYLRNLVSLTPHDERALQAGRPVTKLLEGDPATDVAVFGAIWVAAAPELYIAAVRDIERFERGAHFRRTKKLANPPTLADFDHLDLPDEDVAALRKCRVGECAVKLNGPALERLVKEVDWAKPTAPVDAEAIVRRMAFEYVNAYRQGGNASLAVYHDHNRPTFARQEFESVVAQMPVLTTYLPNLRRHLLEYPQHSLSGSSDFFYIQEVVFGLKPTVRINHVVIADNAEGIAVASKQLYASHYFRTAFELRVLVPDPGRGPGFWFVNVNRSRTDGLSGLLGRLIRGRVRGEAREGMETVLTNTKSQVEAQARKAAA